MRNQDHQFQSWKAIQVNLFDKKHKLQRGLRHSESEANAT